MEETALIDSADHAVAMVGLHPETLSFEPNSAAHIQHNHIHSNGLLQALTTQLDAAGAASPRTNPGQPNASGWATLSPVLDDDGKQLKNGTGKHYKGLNHYNPEWHPNLLPLVAQVQRPVVKNVKNDETLGANVTAGASREALLGTVWHRRDGETHIDQSPGLRAQAAASMKYKLVNESTAGGYRVTSDVTETNNQVTVTLNFENWYLRWLGVYVQFLDSNYNVIPVAKLPSGISASPAQDTKNEVFLGVITPEFVIYGIPCQESKLQVNFTFPTNVASSAKILASGLGFGGGFFPETETVGIALTSTFNLVVPALLLGMGCAQGIDAFIKLAIVPYVKLIVLELTLANLGTGTQVATVLWRQLVRALAGSLPTLIPMLIGKLAAYCVAEEALDAVEDALPIVGAILQSVAVIGIGVELAETAFEVRFSPPTYENDLFLTHDLHWTINGPTPAAANEYTVTAQFDNGGTPVTQTVNLPATLQSVPVTFTDVPLGGQVNISASFYQVPASHTDQHILLGKATTGLVANTADDLAAVTLTQIAFPIGPNTVYVHKQMTALDAQGNHVWKDALAPPTPDMSNFCTAPGTLCDLYGITIRQWAATQAGYVGYTWRGQNSSGETDQRDRMANLNVEPAKAQQGYALAPFALPPSKSAPRLAYSLLAQPNGNFYLDTTTGLVRRVTLGATPGFDPPASKQAWGKLNFASDRLLLHPTGKLVSMNTQISKLESHKPPLQAMADEHAHIQLQALVHGGPGTRPGRLASPAAITITTTGIVVVLEQETNRLQALDSSANPVPYFKKQKSAYYLPLATTDPNTAYLDLATEFTGFLYVLSWNQVSQEYRLDVYHPEQADSTPVSTTLNVNAAKLVVDLWRSVYTLNYEVLQLPGQAMPAFTEPSVSLWVPTLKA